MNKKRVEHIYCELTRIIMTLLTAASFYILYIVTEITKSPEFAMRYYHTYPKMAECMIASIVIYLALSIVFIKIERD